MNTAFAIFRRLNEEFVSNFPEFDEHVEIIAYLYNGYCDPQMENASDFGTYNPGHFRLPSKVFFCDHTFEVLGIFFRGRELPMYQAHLRSELRLSDDEKILSKCLSLLGVLAKYYQQAFLNDQLINGLSHLMNDKKIYTWVVLAIQLFVDTRRVVGKELDRCIW
jgi:hypothetical protein